jgi:hypothetical protein
MPEDARTATRPAGSILRGPMQLLHAATRSAASVRRCLTEYSPRWMCAVAIVALFAVLASRTGSDTDWDLRNYHEYNAHALLSGRFWSDIAPAQLQTFYPPTLDVAFGAVRDALNDWPKLRNAVLSLPQGVAAALAFLLTLRVIPDALPGRVLLGLAATLYSAAGAAGYPTLATAMNDAVPGACILAGLLLLTSESLAPRRSTAAAGVLFGIAGGLKLTSAPCCIAATVALAVAPCRTGSRRLPTLVRFVLGGVAAGALVGGPWWLFLYRNFSSPVLPYLNQIFHSPFADPLPFTDTRFFPRDTLMALAYPFYWAVQPSTLTSELQARDPRFAIAYVVLAVMAVQTLRGRVGGASRNRTIVMLAMFFVVSFALWEMQFSCLRYLATLELLTGAVALMALRPILLRPGIRVPASLGFAALCVAVQAATIYPDWGRMAAPLPQRASLPPVEPDALVVLLDRAPMAYLASLFPITVRLVGANNNLVQPGSANLLAQSAETAIRGHTGPLYGLENPSDAPGAADQTLAYYRLRRGHCAPVQSNLDNNAILWCRLWPQPRQDNRALSLQGPIVPGNP